MLDLDEILQEDNILDILDDDKIKDIAREVHTGYTADWDSRAEWNTNIDQWTKLAAQVMEVKNSPWPNASNVKYPLVTEACIQFSSRIYPAIVTGNSPVKGRVIGADPQGLKLERATRLSKHMSYQLLEQMTEWEEIHDRTGMITALAGCSFKKMYYCPIKQRNVSELVLPKDFVANYYTKDLKSSRRFSQKTEIQGNDIISMQRMDLYSDVDLRTPLQKENALKNQLHGLSAPKVDSTTPYDCIEQHLYLDLDEDGYQEPYIATMDLNSKELLRLVACYDEESITNNYDNEVISIERKEYFVKYGLLPSPDGSFYDYGFGQYIGPINRAVNTLINQLIDKGTLANRGGGFISRGIRVKQGSSRFKIGEYQQVNATGEDLRKGIFPLPIGEPSGTLMALTTYLVNSAQRLASTMDSQVGEDPGQNQKATTTMAVQQQGQKVFSGIYKRFLRSFKEETRLQFNLNKEYLKPEDYFNVIDTGDAEKVFQNDYLGDETDVVPNADPSYTNEQQKLQKAMIAMELATQGMANPTIAAQQIAEAHELPNIKELLTLPEQQPSLEQQQFEDQSLQGWTRLKAEIIEKMANVRGKDAKAMKDIAEAEGVEPGRQLDIYKTMLDELNKDIDRKMSQQEANSGTNREGGAETPST